MKKTYWKELFKTIFHSKVTFLSIMIFIMMGMVLFLGMDWTCCCLTSSTIEYFNNTNVYDIQVNISPGYTKPSDFLNIEGIDEAEGLYEYILPFKDKNNGFEASFSSIPKKISTFTNVEGELPSKEGEVALIRYWADQYEYEIGDSFKINNNPVYLNYSRFSVDEFKVTALIDSPLYMGVNTTIFGVSPTRNIPVNATFFVDESSFNPIINDLTGFNSIYLRSNKLREYDCFSEAYYQEVAKLKKVVESFSNLEGKSYVTSTIRDSMSHQSVQSMTEILGRNKYTMSILFIVVGLLVSYFSISRMIGETATTIGIKKAKGFKNKQIYFFYLMYTNIAVICGAILGVILARFATEPIIMTSVLGAIVLPTANYYIGVPLIFIAFAIELVSQLLITLIATRRYLKRKPIDLIRNENVKLGKQRFYQKGKLWNKLSLFSKTLINNLFNDKTRVLSMLVGIIGCLSLLTCSLTIDRNISDSFDYQFEKVFSFQAVIHYEGDSSQTKQLLDEENYKYDDIMFSYLTIECPNGKKISSQTYIFNDDKFDQFISLYNSSGEKMTFEDGIYSSFSYKEKFGLEENSQIKLTSSSLKTVDVTTKGFFIHYLVNNVILMNSKTYCEYFDASYKPNALIVDLENRNIDDLTNLVILEPCVSYVYDIYNSSEKAFLGITNIFKVVDLVYFILALLMALLVILDLLVMFINEKKDELTILIINGYSRKVAKKYIYFDTIILSIIGIALGTVVGTFMSDLVVKAFQNETIIFMTGFNLISILIATGTGIAIIVGVTLIALKKINKFELKDINKLG